MVSLYTAKAFVARVLGRSEHVTCYGLGLVLRRFHRSFSSVLLFLGEMPFALGRIDIGVLESSATGVFDG